MSLNIYLIENEEVVFEINITHNLSRMAENSELYYAMWRPEEIDVSTAKEVKPILVKGFEKLLNKSEEEVRAYEPANGWGTYEVLCNVALSYIQACTFYPNAIIEVSR